MVQRIYSSRALSPMRFTTFLFADCETYNFIFLKVDFSSLLCLQKEEDIAKDVHKACYFENNDVRNVLSDNNY